MVAASGILSDLVKNTGSLVSNACQRCIQYLHQQHAVPSLSNQVMTAHLSVNRMDAGLRLSRSNHGFFFSFFQLFNTVNIFKQAVVPGVIQTFSTCTVKALINKFKSKLILKYVSFKVLIIINHHIVRFLL